MTPGAVNPYGVTAADVRACMRGDVYGDAASMTDAWFERHVARNDIDLVRSPRWILGDDQLAAFALLAFRDDRAWVGGFGVAPEFRRHGMGKVCVANMLAIARDAGAHSVELEVLQFNAGAVALYRGAGFETVDELVVWRREARSLAGRAGAGTVSDARLDAAAVAAIARTPATCWQREPRSVAASPPFFTVTIGAAPNPQAYAFVLADEPGRATILDAGAQDDASGRTLLDALDARFPFHDLQLVNEPSNGVLNDVLASRADWAATARQYRMRASPS